MGNGWEGESHTENGQVGWERAQKGNQRGDFCKSLSKKSTRLELGDWKERRRKRCRGERTDKQLGTRGEGGTQLSGLSEEALHKAIY